MSHPTPSKTDRAREGGETDQDLVEDPSEEESDLRTLFLDSEDAGDLISSLSSDTARSILVELHDEAGTASELAEAVDTSVQNVRHHLDGLQEAGLVEVTEMRYSPKGREMDVYAPVDEPMVVFVGRQDGNASFVDSLKRFFGAIGVLGLASLAIQWVVESQVAAAGGGGITRSPDSVGGTLATTGVPPGALFFGGGALILLVVSVWRYWTRNPAPTTG